MKIIFGQILVQMQHYVGTGEGAIDGSIIDRYVTNPISDNLQLFTTFVYAICGFMGLLGGLKIYFKSMNGDDDIEGYGFRWVAAIIAVLLVGTLLQRIASQQKPFSGDSNVENFINE
ncbi:DUF4134 family protein [Dyadobacter psychrotolerans]|jgi:hypothetical protein|uniref:DUF4134 domain-containing protein n=1 Tax=Dyadobacter psychrotolerans TaxID=2541721 RepID=A0A4R5DDP1_9BACT|nr:DUF4134 family protein [Dyadobacter psychrotolerans]TDE09804.1 DUF4134 domain-containing protein [Dyadobacter psychrotolerans]